MEASGCEPEQESAPVGEGAAEKMPLWGWGGGTGFLVKELAKF